MPNDSVPYSNKYVTVEPIKSITILSDSRAMK